MENIRERLEKLKIVVILRGLTESESEKCVEKLYEAGIRFLEVTFQSDSEEDIESTARTISSINKKYSDLYVGAGTVVCTEQVNAAYKAGAKFVLSPNLNADVVKKTLSYGMLSFPGAFSPTELLQAYKLGATCVKWFPATLLGEDYLKAVGEPLGYIPVMAVGGIDTDNIKSYYDAGAEVFGIGSSLVNSELVHTGNYNEIFNRAQKFVEIVEGLA